MCGRASREGHRLKAQTRLCARYRTLAARGKRLTVAVTAIARELAGFVWAIGREAEVKLV
jgi:transposase